MRVLVNFSTVAMLMATLVVHANPMGEGLTPYGAEQNGNADNTIPAWEGGITPDAMPKIEKGLENPFKDEKPLYVVTANNQSQYDSVLSAGQKALLAAYPKTYQIPVYPSHRTASAPQWVYDNIARNHSTAKLVNEGNGIEDAFGGVPFPVPKNAEGQYDAHKILWNHLTRWRGIYVTAESSDAPVQTSGSYSLVTSQQEVGFLFYDPKRTFDTLDNKLSYFMASIKKPARLAGGAVLIHETLDRTKEERLAWAYNSGTRRVRRAPSVAYDMPVASTENLLTADDVDMFNGAPDRYDWQYIGKQELLIPYNNFELSNATADHKRVLQKGHINPELTRYEMHRVWVIEGTLKSGVRHVYQKRRFYIDEDSWSIVQADQYDARGELWRVHLSYLVNYYHVPVTWAALSANYDLVSKRYFAGFLDNSNGIAIKFSDTMPPETYFKPQSLRRRGR